MTAADLSTRLNRERADLERRTLAAIVEAKYGAMPPMPVRLAGESDNDWIDRLAAWRNGPRLPLPAEGPPTAECAENRETFPHTAETADETAQNTMSRSEP